MPIGFRTSKGGAGLGALETITKHTAVYSNTTTIDIPATVVDGDLGVLFNTASSFFGAITYVEPANWTNIYNRSWTTTGTARATAFVKLLTTDEANDTLTLMNGGLNEFISLWIFRGNVNIQSFSLFSSNHVWTNGDPGAQSMAAAGRTSPIMAFVDYSSSGNVQSTESVTFDEVSDNTYSTSIRNGYKVWNVGDTPADVTGDTTDAGNANRIDVFCLEVR